MVRKLFQFQILDKNEKRKAALILRKIPTVVIFVVIQRVVLAT